MVVMCHKLVLILSPRMIRFQLVHAACRTAPLASGRATINDEMICGGSAWSLC